MRWCVFGFDGILLTRKGKRHMLMVTNTKVRFQPPSAAVLRPAAGYVFMSRFLPVFAATVPR
jgi:hypothetical protein